MEGWVKLWRKSIKNGWLRNHKLWIFWTYCLMKASGLETDEIERHSQVKLKRGQFIFGIHQAMKDTGLTYQNIRTCLSTLEKWGNINKQSNNLFSIITILKYNSYNVNTKPSNKPTNKQVTINQQSSNNQSNNIKEDKKDKERKERHLARPKADPRVSELFKYWDSKYQALTGEKYLFAGAKEGPLIKRLLGTYGRDKSLDLVDYFFKQSEEPNCWWRDKISIGTFYSCVPKIIRQITSGIKDGEK